MYKLFRRNRTGGDRCVGMCVVYRRNRTGGDRRDQLYAVYRRKVFIRGCVGMYKLFRRNRAGGDRRDRVYAVYRRIIIGDRRDGMYVVLGGYPCVCTRWVVRSNLPVSLLYCIKFAMRVCLPCKRFLYMELCM
jgi:hypothetical protein